MKDQSKMSYLQGAKPAQSPEASGSLISLHERVLQQCGQSIAQANDLFVAWLEALGAANVGISDEHIDPSNHQSSRNVP